jgi:hypothetical protein
MPVLWALWGIAVLNVLALLVNLLACLIRPHSTLGSSLLGLLLVYFLIVTTFIGGFSGLALILLTDGGVVLVVSTVVLLAGAAFVIAVVLHRIWLSGAVSRAGKRLLSRDEMLDLIRANLVGSFSRRDGLLEVELKLRAAKEPELRKRRAHPRDYLAFVAAVKEGGAAMRKIRYDDDTGEGPSSTDRRWITVEETAALLGAGQVKTFSCGGDESPGEVRTFRGTPTGIRLTDHGWARHIAAGPELAATLVPLARVARAAHGRPHIAVNGHYER